MSDKLEQTVRVPRSPLPFYDEWSLTSSYLFRGSTIGGAIRMSIHWDFCESETERRRGFPGTCSGDSQIQQSEPYRCLSVRQSSYWWHDSSIGSSSRTTWRRRSTFISTTSIPTRRVISSRLLFLRYPLDVHLLLLHFMCSSISRALSNPPLYRALSLRYPLLYISFWPLPAPPSSLFVCSFLL